MQPAKNDKTLETLYLAADQFIAKRDYRRDGDVNDISRVSRGLRTGAGMRLYHCRDCFWRRGRFDEAKSVLVTFARAASNGMIPSRFDDYSSAAHFNSVDASLWFINAAFAYLKASGDRRTFREELLPVVISIINSYQHGTQFGIHADSDGLITAGDASTQLTWMDAKYKGVVFTPRYGKPVEVNALWYNALMLLSQYLTETNDNQIA